MSMLEMRMPRSFGLHVSYLAGIIFSVPSAFDLLGAAEWPCVERASSSSGSFDELPGVGSDLGCGSVGACEVRGCEAPDEALFDVIGELDKMSAGSASFLLRAPLAVEPGGLSAAAATLRPAVGG